MEHKSSLYRAIGKSMLGRYAVYGANLISMMLLARIFTPETFGTVAAITVFFLFFQLMAEAGLGPAIINLKELDPRDRDGLFGLTLVGGVILGLIMAAMAPTLLLFYQLPRVDEVVPYIALGVVFYSASIVPTAMLLRDQAFFRIANAGLLAETLSTVITIGLAYIIDPLHALAAKASFSAAITFSVMYYFSGKTAFGRPKPGGRFSAIKPLLGFSGYQFGFNFINYFSRNLDNILVGKYLGAATLGVYDKAYQLMRYPLMLLTFAMTPAIQPVIRQISDDVSKVESIHLDFTFKLSIAGSIAGILLYLLADLIVVIILGHQWHEVTPIIKILAIAIPAQIVLSTSGSFFQAMGRADLLFLSGVLSAAAMIAAIIWGIYKGDVLALSWGLVIAFHINFIQAYWLMYRKIFNQSLTHFFLRMSPAGVSVIAMAVHLSLSSR